MPTTRGPLDTGTAAARAGVPVGEALERMANGGRGNPRQKVAPDARWASAGESDEDSVLVVVPVRTVNLTNGAARGRMRANVKRGRDERDATLLMLRAHEPKREVLARGCVVTLTRVSAGTLDPLDGLGPALKHIRDACAMWLLSGRPGEMDQDERITWRLEQRNLGRGVAGVIVSIRPRGA